MILTSTFLFLFLLPGLNFFHTVEVRQPFRDLLIDVIRGVLDLVVESDLAISTGRRLERLQDATVVDPFDLAVTRDLTGERHQGIWKNAHYNWLF